MDTEETKEEETPPHEPASTNLDERVTNVEKSMAELIVVVAEINVKLDAALQQKETEHGTGTTDDTPPDDGRTAEKGEETQDTPPRPQHRWYRKPGE